MFSDNLVSLRKKSGFSQENLAERIGISRQTLSKYETGESVPDIRTAKTIADLFDVSLDDLMSDEHAPGISGLPPRGKYVFGVVKLGEKGQIIIPAKARRVFSIKPGDSLIVLGDETRGIAIAKEEDFLGMINEMNKAINNVGGSV